MARRVAWVVRVALGGLWSLGWRVALRVALGALGGVFWPRLALGGDGRERRRQARDGRRMARRVAGGASGGVRRAGWRGARRAAGPVLRATRSAIWGGVRFASERGMAVGRWRGFQVALMTRAIVLGLTSAWRHGAQLVAAVASGGAVFWVARCLCVAGREVRSVLRSHGQRRGEIFCPLPTWPCFIKNAVLSAPGAVERVGWRRLRWVTLTVLVGVLGGAGRAPRLFLRRAAGSDARKRARKQAGFFTARDP